MIILSWDVGVIHLAYCVLKLNEKTKKIDILDWDNINLIEDERLELKCCGNKKAKKNALECKCNNNATHYMKVNGKNIGFCKVHLKQTSDYWSTKDTEKMFSQVSTNNTCCFHKRNGSECGAKTRYVYSEGKEKSYYCTTHYKSFLKKKTKDLSPKPIKNLIVKKYPTFKLQYTLVTKLDKLSKHFSMLGIQEVIIENQPSHKNPKMKSISNTLFDYFMIRGYIDKYNGLNIDLVRFICPSNKLKVNNKNTIEIFKAEKSNGDKKKYKLTKALGIQYTKQLLSNNPKQLEYLNLYKKKDDICDAYLQGRYYLEILRK